MVHRGMGTDDEYRCCGFHSWYEFNGNGTLLEWEKGHHIEMTHVYHMNNVLEFCLVLKASGALKKTFYEFSRL